jgi:hypothetical protein
MAMDTITAIDAKRPPRTNPDHRRQRPAAGPDRFAVLFLTIAAFLAVLALLASQLRASAPAIPKPVVVLRRIYETRVVETIKGSGSASPSGTSVTQVSSGGSPAASVPAPATRSS